MCTVGKRYLLLTITGPRPSFFISKLMQGSRTEGDDVLLDTAGNFHTFVGSSILLCEALQGLLEFLSGFQLGILRPLNTL